MPNFMSGQESKIIVLSGAGGGSPSTELFTIDPKEAHRYTTIHYPGWQRYIKADFSIARLLTELSDEIETAIPQNPIYIVGISLGGHFGYALSNLLLKRGRIIGGFCAIDAFMVNTSAPQDNWKKRALERAVNLIREGRVSDFGVFIRARFWRALLRLAGGRLPGLIHLITQEGQLPVLLRIDPLFEEELSMRLLIRYSAPWLAELDLRPQAMAAPALLIRTMHTATDDEMWKRRCPHIQIVDVPGNHQTLFDLNNLHILRSAFIKFTQNWG